MATHAANTEFWATKSSSLHRGTGPVFYRQKALEHVGFMDPRDRSAGVIDLACGAGELLAECLGELQVSAGLDLSASMLEQAAQRLSGSDVNLVLEPALEHLSRTRYRVWMTTGGLNQYYNPAEQRRLLDLFAGTEETRSYYMFDCVDPVRYRMMPLGIGYLPQLQPRNATWRHRARSLLLRARACYQLLGGQSLRPAVPLGRPGMGWGFSPRFWLDEATERGLDVRIGSSILYEYRYHVAVTKRHSVDA